MAPRQRSSYARRRASRHRARKKRRQLLAKAGAILRVALMLAALGAGYLWWTSSILDYAPRAEPAGFRDVLVRADYSPINETATQLAIVAEPPADVCEALYGDPDVPAYGPEDADVWIAYFTDAGCSYCRLLEETLDELRIRRNDVRVLYFDWPILGKGSIAAARASVAAARQRGYLPMHRRLMRSRSAVTPAYLKAMTRNIGLEPDRLERDLSDPRIPETPS